MSGRPRIAVVDLGAGNLASLCAALAAVGGEPLRATEPGALRGAAAVVLPGVGQFAAAARALDAWRGALADAVDRGLPLLGICLGMQLLFAEGEEGGTRAPGLGLLPGRVRALAGWTDPPRAPHMAWTPVRRTAPSPLLAGIPDGTAFYFAHSYAADPQGPAPWVAAVAAYRLPFPAVVAAGNVHGVQFHPERSGEAGLRLLARFVELARRPAPWPSAGPVAARGFRVLPALDLRGGRCVRLEAGDFSRERVVADDPVAAARRWVEAGARELHVVDLDGARAGRPVHLETLRAVCALGVPVQAGGGVRDPEAVRQLLAAGVARVLVGTAAAEDPELLARLVEAAGGALRVSLDLRADPAAAADPAAPAAWRLAGRGWQALGRPLPEALADLGRLGIREVVVSDVARDGTRAGVRPEPFLAVARAGLSVLAAGGVADAADLDLLAGLPGVVGAVVGRAAYEGAAPPERLFGWPPRPVPAPEGGERPEPATARCAGAAAGCAARPAGPVAAAAVAPAAGGGRPGAGRAAAPSAAMPRLIPCLDVRGGRVVKGVRFRHLRDLGDPVALARRYAAEGADELVLLDIAATPEGRGTLLALVRAVAEAVFVPLTVGGGIRSVEDARAVFLAGADKVAVNTAAVERPALLAELAARFGRQATVLAVDARRSRHPACPSGWEVVTHAGTRPRGLDALAWCRQAVALGAGEILVTSVDRDGTRQGYDLELLAALRAAVDVPIVASGGAGSPADLAAAVAAGADAVLVASLLHEGDWDVGGLKAALRRQGVAVRA